MELKQTIDKLFELSKERETEGYFIDASDFSFKAHLLILLDKLSRKRK